LNLIERNMLRNKIFESLINSLKPWNTNNLCSSSVHLLQLFFFSGKGIGWKRGDNWIFGIKIWEVSTLKPFCVAQINSCWWSMVSSSTIDKPLASMLHQSFSFFSILFYQLCDFFPSSFLLYIVLSDFLYILIGCRSYL